jgi:hypothetical protein
VHVSSIACLAAEEMHIVRADGVAFCHLAQRSDSSASREIFESLARGEEQVHPLLCALASAAGLDKPALDAYVPTQGCQGYAQYVAWLALNADPDEVVVALVANFQAWGEACAALADSLRVQYKFSNEACAFLDYFAPGPSLEDLVSKVEVLRNEMEGKRLKRVEYYMQTLKFHEKMFWETLAAIMVHREAYSQFSSISYCKTYYTDVNGSSEEPNLILFYLRQYRRYFLDRTPSHPGQLVKWLDYGSGPSFWQYTFLPLEDKGDWHLFLSDFSEPNRKALTAFLANNQTVELHDWHKFFASAIQEIENLSKDESAAAAAERIAWIRNKQPEVLHCDILAEKPLSYAGDISEAFTLVTSNLCLEAATTSEENYKEALAKLGGMVAKGGDLLMSIVERETFYTVENMKYAVVSVKQEWIQSQFRQPEWECNITRMEMSSHTVSDFSGVLFICAHKNKVPS